MLWLVLATSALSTQASGILPFAIDVSTLEVGEPKVVVELDLGKLKGELRQLSWSPDGTKFCIETAEGNPQTPKLRHYTVAVEGGAIAEIAAQPDWAAEYWAFKSDRLAPGAEWIAIDVEQKIETIKAGTGPAGALDRTSSPAGGGNIMNTENIAKGTDQYQKANVVRLRVFDQVVSEFMNERPIPGLMFGWGPEKSGAIAYTDREGHLTLLDSKKHKKTIAAAKDALLPAWTTDGDRLAWVQKTGRRKYALLYAMIGR